MTKAERILAARFLTIAASEYGNRGCNDTPSELFRGLSESEKQEIERGYNLWNSRGDPDQWVPFNHIPDFAFMGYIAHRVEE